jgi:flagellar P-ring protein precursor FlgI
MAQRFIHILALLLLMLALTAPAQAAWAAGKVRIKDITDLEGARSNQLVGFGLVTGLDGTGSRSPFTQRVAVNLLERFKIAGKIVSEARGDPVFRSGSISAVMVTAELGAFARAGTRIDVTVSVLDDATSLQGGMLIMTPLKGVDNVDYAVAQGPISIGGFSFAVPTGSQTPTASAQKNHPTAGRIPGGAIIEREVRGEVVCDGSIRLLLKSPDFSTAREIVRVVNERYPGSSVALDGGTVQVALPRALTANPVAFASDVGQLEVTPDTIARVVINERTGTVVAGEHVRISPVAVTQGNLAIATSDEPLVSQPPPLSLGGTVVLPRPRIEVVEQRGTLRYLDRTVTVLELSQALNRLGVTPRDLIAIFQSLKEAGALHAELIIM